MRFLPYQKRWILDESVIKVYEKSRRIGITYATSYRAARKCLRSGRKNSSFRQWVSSRDDLTAGQFITDYVANWAREANRIAREAAAGKQVFELRDPDTGEVYETLDRKGAEEYAEGWKDCVGLDGKNLELVDEKTGINAHVVKFRNGARIYSLSSNPKAFAGKGGDVLIDEFDLHDNQQVMYDMAFPCTIQGDQLEIVSAYDPEGSEQTPFAVLCRDCKNGLHPEISFHSTTLTEAVEDGYVEMINELRSAKGRPTQSREDFISSIRKGCRTLDSFNSQFMCIPNKASGEQMIAPELLSAAQKKLDVLYVHCEGMSQLENRRDFFEPEFWADVFGNGNYALGWDIAATRDMSCIWVNRLLDSDVPGKPLHRLFILVTMHGCDRLTRQREVVEAMFRSTYNLVGAGDKGGLGWSECTELELKYRAGENRTRFAAVNFSASKLTLGTTMQGAYEQGRQEIAIDYPEIAADIAGIKKGRTPVSGKLTFTESENSLLPCSHCDLGWSGGLAIYAGETLRSSGPCRLEPCAALSEPQIKQNNFNNPDRKTHYEVSETVWPV